MVPSLVVQLCSQKDEAISRQKYKTGMGEYYYQEHNLGLLAHHEVHQDLFHCEWEKWENAAKFSVYAYRALENLYT